MVARMVRKITSGLPYHEVGRIPDTINVSGMRPTPHINWSDVADTERLKGQEIAHRRVN